MVAGVAGAGGHLPCGALSPRLDGVGVAAPARSPHALARPALHRARQLPRGLRRPALLGGARRTRCSSPRRASPSSSCSACVLALAMNRAFRGRALVRAVGARAVGDADGGVGAALAVHVRRRRRNRQRGCWSRSGSSTHPLVWFIRYRPRVGAGDAGRRLEDHAVRRPAAAGRAPEHRRRRSTRRRGSTAPPPGASSATSRCRCSGRRSSSR